MHLIKEIQFINNRNKYLILNLINGAADIINEHIYQQLYQNNFNNLDKETIAQLKQRKFLFEQEDEYQTFLSKLDARLEHLETTSTPSFLIIPSYACNLNCTYCYEQSYDIQRNSTPNKRAIIDKQFHTISQIIKDIPTSVNPQDIKITIMGGEPLMPGNIAIINYILEKAASHRYKVNIITNGVALSLFIPLLKSEVVEHIQITLDGPRKIHDSRRKFHNGAGSFDTIISNIKLALKGGIKIFLRVNVDNENINSLPELADILTTNFNNNRNLHPYLYILQDGGCHGSQNVLEENIGIEKIFEMEKQNPNMQIFAPKYHPANFVNAIFSDKAFQPVLRHCGASRNQYILDYKGNIHKCWHGIGNEKYRVGVFKQTTKFNKKKDKWINRSTKNLQQCTTCKYRYICGTGCPAAKHGGCTTTDLSKPNCVDYEKLINMLVLKHINHLE